MALLNEVFNDRAIESIDHYNQTKRFFIIERTGVMEPINAGFKPESLNKEKFLTYCFSSKNEEKEHCLCEGGKCLKCGIEIVAVNGDKTYCPICNSIIDCNAIFLKGLK